MPTAVTQMPFIEFVIGHTIVTGLGRDASGDEDAEWKDCMDACGISVETQDVIMDPHFAYLRRSNSCVYWARETINIRYAVLVSISYTRKYGKEQQHVPVASSGGWSSQRTTAAYSTPGYMVLYKTVIQPRYGHSTIKQALSQTSALFTAGRLPISVEAKA